MLYVGAYQVRAVEHLKCPLLKKGCEVVADAPFARPFGIPDGFIAASLYVLLMGLAILHFHGTPIRYIIRGGQRPWRGGYGPFGLVLFLLPPDNRSRTAPGVGCVCDVRISSPLERTALDETTRCRFRRLGHFVRCPLPHHARRPQRGWRPACSFDVVEAAPTRIHLAPIAHGAIRRLLECYRIGAAIGRQRTAHPHRRGTTEWADGSLSFPICF